MRAGTVVTQINVVLNQAPDRTGRDPQVPSALSLLAYSSIGHIGYFPPMTGNPDPGGFVKAEFAQGFTG